MKKTIVLTVLAVALASSASTSFAQDVQTDESRLAQEYYSALYGKKDTLKAECLKSEILAKYPKGAFARRLSAEAVNMASDSLDYIRRADEFRNGFPISEWIENPDGQGFAVFGQVTDGMSTVHAIQTLPDNQQYLIEPVVIRSIRRLP